MRPQKYLTKSGEVRWRTRYGKGPLKTFLRKSDADEYYAEQARNRQRAKAGLETGREPITFRQLHEKWRKAARPTPWTLAMTQPGLDAFGAKYLGEITTDDIGIWLNGLKKQNGQPYAEKTRRHILTALRQVLNSAVDYGYIPRSPASPRFRTSLDVPTDTRVRAIRPFESWDEVEAVADANTEGDFIRLACLTGIRVPGEAFALGLAHIDWTNKLLTVPGTKTALAQRTVPLSREAIIVLERIVQVPNITARLFEFDYEYWRRYDWPVSLKDAGMEPRTPYEMRHTFATLALSHGASIADVASAMGHTDIQRCYQTYRKWTRDMHDRLRNDLDKIGGTHGIRAAELS